MSEDLDKRESGQKRCRLDQTVPTTESNQKEASITSASVSNYHCVICLNTSNWNDRCYCCSNKHALCRLCYHHLLADNRLSLRPSFCPICRSLLSYSETNAHPDIYNLSMEAGSVQMPQPSGINVCSSPSVASTSRQSEPNVSQEVLVSLVRQAPSLGLDLENEGDDDTHIAESNDYIFFISKKLTFGGQDFLLIFYVNGGNKTRQQILKNDERRSLWYQWIWLGSGIPFMEGKKRLLVSYNVTPCLMRLGREVAGPPSHILQPLETEVAKHVNYWQFKMQEREPEEDEDDHENGTYEILGEGEEIHRDDITYPIILSPSAPAPMPVLNPTSSTALAPPSSLSSASFIALSRSMLSRFLRIPTVLRHSIAGALRWHLAEAIHEALAGLPYVYSQQLRVSDCKDTKMPANQKGGDQVTPCHQLIHVSPDIVNALLAKGEFVVRVTMWMQKEGERERSEHKNMV